MSEHSFARTARLLTAKDYKQVFDAVHIKLHQPNLMCLVSIQAKQPDAHTADLSTSRLGLAISKAKNKHAHERNRIKRLVRESFRQQHHLLSEQVDMVFLTKTRTDTISNAVLQKQLSTMWYTLNKRLTP